MPQNITVYFDYLCPFCWRFAEVVELIKPHVDITFLWHHFSLYQSNYEGDDQWQLWNDSLKLDDAQGSQGLLPFLASCAARAQGAALHDRFRLGLLRARHAQHAPLTKATIFEVAQAVGLDLPAFAAEIENPENRTRLAQEHHLAASLDVFGTPTLHVFSDHLAYLRLREIPASDKEALALFGDCCRLLERYPYLETIKRPRRKQN